MSRIRIGIVGLNFGRHVVGQLRQEPGFEIAGVCDLDASRAAEVAQRVGVRTYRTLEELLADASVPAIGLFTGPGGRAGLVRQAIRAGKHVMTTKPFELDPVAALEVLHEARRLGRVVHLNSPSPLPPPDLVQIAAWRERFRLGKPVGCRADVWAYYREQADGSWYDDAQRCPVAPVFRLGIYLINDLVWLFGPATQVQVLRSRLLTGRPTADNAQLGILFENGALANVFASFCVNDGDPYRNSLVLNFQHGTIYRNVGPVRADAAPCELALVQSVGGRRSLVERATQPGTSGLYQWDVFRRAIEGEKLVGEISPAQVVAGLHILRAMAVAEQTGGGADGCP